MFKAYVFVYNNKKKYLRDVWVAVELNRLYGAPCIWKTIVCSANSPSYFIEIFCKNRDKITYSVMGDYLFNGSV